MDIAPTLVKQLASLGISYDIIHHHHSSSSLDVAHSAHIPAAKMVKPVILEDDRGYVMALLPADQHLRIRELSMHLNRDMDLATESQFAKLFADCEPGAIPPIGEAYGMQTVVDEQLDDCSDVYLEAGNHTAVLHLSGSSLRKLMAHSHHASISRH